MASVDLPRHAVVPQNSTAVSNVLTSPSISQSSESQGSESDADSHSHSGQHNHGTARSQVSTAVSFEGTSARAAGSAIQQAQSINEESALSAAEGEVAQGPARPARGAAPRPTNSLISTAVQRPSRHEQHASSPKVHRGTNSGVSQAAGNKLDQQAPRGGTPASVYGQLSLGRGHHTRSMSRKEGRGHNEQVSGAQQASHNLLASAAAQVSAGLTGSGGPPIGQLWVPDTGVASALHTVAQSHSLHPAFLDGNAFHDARNHHSSAIAAAAAHLAGGGSDLFPYLPFSLGNAAMAASQAPGQHQQVHQGEQVLMPHSLGIPAGLLHLAPAASEAAMQGGEQNGQLHPSHSLLQEGQGSQVGHVGDLGLLCSAAAPAGSAALSLLHQAPPQAVHAPLPGPQAPFLPDNVQLPYNLAASLSVNLDTQLQQHPVPAHSQAEHLGSFAGQLQCSYQGQVSGAAGLQTNMQQQQQQQGLHVLHVSAEESLHEGAADGHEHSEEADAPGETAAGREASAVQSQLAVGGSLGLGQDLVSELQGQHSQGGEVSPQVSNHVSNQVDSAQHVPSLHGNNGGLHSNVHQSLTYHSQPAQQLLSTMLQQAASVVLNAQVQQPQNSGMQGLESSATIPHCSSPKTCGPAHPKGSVSRPQTGISEDHSGSPLRGHLRNSSHSQDLDKRSQPNQPERTSGRSLGNGAVHNPAVPGEGEVVSQHCGGSQSTSPLAPSALAQGEPAGNDPTSLHEVMSSGGPLQGPRDSSMAMAIAGVSTRSGTISGGGPTNSGTVDMSTGLRDSQMANASSSSSEGDDEGDVGNNNTTRSREAAGQCEAEAQEGQQAAVHPAGERPMARVSSSGTRNQSLYARAGTRPFQANDVQDVGSPDPGELGQMVVSTAAGPMHEENARQQSAMDNSTPGMPNNLDGTPYYDGRHAWLQEAATCTASNINSSNRGRSSREYQNGTRGGAGGSRRRPAVGSSSHKSGVAAARQMANQHPAERGAENEAVAALGVQVADNVDVVAEQAASHLNPLQVLGVLHVALPHQQELPGNANQAQAANSASTADNRRNSRSHGSAVVPSNAALLGAGCVLLPSVLTTASQPQVPNHGHISRSHGVERSASAVLPQDTEVHGLYANLAATAAAAQMTVAAAAGSSAGHGHGGHFSGALAGLQALPLPTAAHPDGAQFAGQSFPFDAQISTQGPLPNNPPGPGAAMQAAAPAQSVAGSQSGSRPGEAGPSKAHRHGHNNNTRRSHNHHHHQHSNQLSNYPNTRHDRGPGPNHASNCKPAENMHNSVGCPVQSYEAAVVGSKLLKPLEQPADMAAVAPAEAEMHGHFSAGQHLDGPAQPQMTIMVNSQHNLQHGTESGDEELDGPAVSPQNASWHRDSDLTSPKGSSATGQTRRGEKRKRAASAQEGEGVEQADGVNLGAESAELSGS